jgi:hypothetical protein
VGVLTPDMSALDGLLLNSRDFSHGWFANCHVRSPVNTRGHTQAPQPAGEHASQPEPASTLCFLISRGWQSSDKPVKGLSSSATLYNAVSSASSASSSQQNRTHQRHRGRRSQIEVATCARPSRTAHTPDVQVDHGLERESGNGTVKGVSV